jgi:hypothetical protein
MGGKRCFDLTKFNAKPTALDLKIATAEELVATSTVAIPLPPQPMRGTVGFPPNPCVGGTTSATLLFTV